MRNLIKTHPILGRVITFLVLSTSTYFVGFLLIQIRNSFGPSQGMAGGIVSGMGTVLAMFIFFIASSVVKENKFYKGTSVIKRVGVVLLELFMFMGLSLLVLSLLP